MFLCHLETSNRNNQQKLAYLVEGNDTIYKFSSLTKNKFLRCSVAGMEEAKSRGNRDLEALSCVPGQR